MKDYLIKALGYEGQVRAYAVSTTDTVGEVSATPLYMAYCSRCPWACNDCRCNDGRNVKR